MSKNKTILIIGAKSDIALAVAKKFASKGFNLQLAARNSSELGVRTEGGGGSGSSRLGLGIYLVGPGLGQGLENRFFVEY